VAVGVEDIDKAVPRPTHVIALVGTLQRIGHKQVTIDILDSKRREAGGIR